MNSAPPELRAVSLRSSAFFQSFSTFTRIYPVAAGVERVDLHLQDQVSSRGYLLPPQRLPRLLATLLSVDRKRWHFRLAMDLIIQ